MLIGWWIKNVKNTYFWGEKKEKTNDRSLQTVTSVLPNGCSCHFPASHHVRMHVRYAACGIHALLISVWLVICIYTIGVPRPRQSRLFVLQTASRLSCTITILYVCETVCTSRGATQQISSPYGPGGCNRWLTSDELTRRHFRNSTVLFGGFGGRDFFRTQYGPVDFRYDSRRSIILTGGVRRHYMGIKIFFHYNNGRVMCAVRRGLEEYKYKRDRCKGQLPDAVPYQHAGDNAGFFFCRCGRGARRYD